MTLYGIVYNGMLYYIVLPWRRVRGGGDGGEGGEGVMEEREGSDGGEGGEGVMEEREGRE